MPFVQPLASDANPDVAELARFFNETLGLCPNSVLTMSHRPAIAKAFIQLNMAVMDNQGRVSSALKRLIAYVSSHATRNAEAKHGDSAAEPGSSLPGIGTATLSRQPTRCCFGVLASAVGGVGVE